MPWCRQGVRPSVVGEGKPAAPLELSHAGQRDQVEVVPHAALVERDRNSFVRLQVDRGVVRHNQNISCDDLVGLLTRHLETLLSASAGSGR